MENKQRQIAYKIRVQDILKGEYVKEAGWAPNYILYGKQKVSRVNLIGAIVAMPPTETNKEILIDDGTGRISARSFDDSEIFKGLTIGEFILIIGRPREYGGEKYVVPEIIRKVDKRWFELRLIELKGPYKSIGTGISSVKDKEEMIGELVKSKINSDDVLNLIKRFDKGSGMDYEELAGKLGDDAVIKTLLEEGEIFEVTPGKLKAL